MHFYLYSIVVLRSQLNDMMKMQQQQGSSTSSPHRQMSHTPMSNPQLPHPQLPHPTLPPRSVSHSLLRESKEKSAANHQEFMASLSISKVCVITLCPFCPSSMPKLAVFCMLSDAMKCMDFARCKQGLLEGSKLYVLHQWLTCIYMYM